MRYAPYLLCLIGFVAVAFGYWGVSTVSGRRIFDEMAGMIPLGVGLIGALAVISGLVWMVVRARI